MSTFTLSGPGLVLTFDHSGDRLLLVQMQRVGEPPMLHGEASAGQAGPGPVGNPLAVVIHDGPHAGSYGIGSFRVKKLEKTDTRLLAYLAHDAVPMELAIEVEVEGHVATWRGQACWAGTSPAEIEIYFPIFSRLRFSSSGADRALVATISGAVLEPLSAVNFHKPYLGNVACPAFIVEGGGRGLAVLDDNRADLAADPGACVRRSHVIGNRFPLPVHTHWPPRDDPAPAGGDGPFAGICHSRRFGPQASTHVDDLTAEGGKVALPMICLGDAADLGPVRTFAYAGSWRAGAAWLRDQRRHVPFRSSPAEWYRRTTFVSEHQGDAMLRDGLSFYDYPKILAMKQRLGSDFFHMYGFHDPEVLGTTQNWLNRGDYYFAAQNLGGFEGVRRGVEAIHRQGGRIIYYVEGLIMWKRSRIGRSNGRDWALMKADGSYDEHYKGFWHMCPACEGWCEWLARTCADIVQSTSIDGFFIDSVCATHNHRCYNPAHNHPHPDVWNWGVRQMLRRVRESVDAVNPGTILIVEGCGDLAREHADGFLSHGHAWTGMRLDEPFVRFLHPQMRAFESWSSRRETSPEKPMERLHIWNSVNGYRIYAHNPDCGEMAELGVRTRRYYDMYPEICDGEMSVLEVGCENCMAQLFEGAPPVITVGNGTGQPVQATLSIPVPCGMLFDRVDSQRVPVVDGRAKMELGAWEVRAFEVRG